MSSLINQLYRFGDFTLDLDQRVLLRAGKPLPLTPKVFDTLLILVQHSNRVVTKDDLMRQLWPNTFVAEANITFNIQQLRKVLGDDARRPRYIETVSRRGYRFIANVEVVIDGDASKLSPLVSATIGDGLQNQPAVSASVAASAPLIDSGASTRRKVIAIGASVLIIGLLGLGLWRLTGFIKKGATDDKRADGKTAVASPLKIEKLTVTGQSAHAAISPDGKFVAYTRFFENKTGVWLRQLASNTNVEIVPAGEPVAGMGFTRSGEYLYLVKGDPPVLFRMSPLGGVPTKVLENLEGNFSISSDDSQVAFIRQEINGEGQREYFLMTARSDGSNERRILTGTHPYKLDTPLWSATGDAIVCSYGNSTGSNQNVTLIEVKVADGTKRELFPTRFFAIQRVSLLPYGKGLIFLARTTPEENNQLWQVTYPSMEIRQLSEGVISYGDLSLTALGEKAASTQVTRIADIWVGSAHDASNLKRITQATDGCWTPNGRIVYSSTASGNRDLWIMQRDGTEQRQLTADPAVDASPAVTPDNRYIIFTSYRSGTFQIWRMNMDGGNQIQLTSGPGKQFPSISSDGRWVLYNSTDDWSLWKISIDGGEPVRLTEYPAVYSSVSPDGKTIACAGRNEPKRPFGIWLLPIEGGQPFKRIESPGAFAGGRLYWTPDGKALIYSAARNGRTAIIKLTLASELAEEIATIDQDELFDFAYSNDGQSLFVTRGGWKHDVVLISDFGR